MMRSLTYQSNGLASKDKKSRARLGSAVVIILLAMGLTGCGSDDNINLQDYVKEVKARQKGHIPPLPKPQTFEIFTYNDSALRNPFVATVEVKAADTNNGLKPDLSRERDVLEQYAVGSLKMMGSLEKNGHRWALIRASDGTLYRVKTGRHLGKNNGVILKITETELELKEIVPDGLGGWVERMTTLAVSE